MQHYVHSNIHVSNRHTMLSQIQNIIDANLTTNTLLLYLNNTNTGEHHLNTKQIIKTFFQTNSDDNPRKMLQHESTHCRNYTENVITLIRNDNNFQLENVNNTSKLCGFFSKQGFCGNAVKYYIEFRCGASDCSHILSNTDFENLKNSLACDTKNRDGQKQILFCNVQNCWLI